LTGLTRANSSEVHDYYVTLDPFAISKHTNGKESLSTKNQLYFENHTTGSGYTPGSVCFDGFATRAQARSGIDIYSTDPASIK